MVLVLLGAAIPGGLLQAASGAAAWTGPLSGLISMLAILWVHCVYFVSPQALVVERISPWRALGRSRGLTRGSRCRIFGLLFLLLVLYGLLVRGVNALLGVPESLAGFELRFALQLGVGALLAAFAALALYGIRSEAKL